MHVVYNLAIYVAACSTSQHCQRHWYKNV